MVGWHLLIYEIWDMHECMKEIHADNTWVVRGKVKYKCTLDMLSSNFSVLEWSFFDIWSTKYMHEFVKEIDGGNGIGVRINLDQRTLMRIKGYHCYSSWMCLVVTQQGPSSKALHQELSIPLPSKLTMTEATPTRLPRPSPLQCSVSSQSGVTCVVPRNSLISNTSFIVS